LNLGTKPMAFTMILYQKENPWNGWFTKARGSKGDSFKRRSQRFFGILRRAFLIDFKHHRYRGIPRIFLIKEY